MRGDYIACCCPSGFTVLYRICSQSRYPEGRLLTGLPRISPVSRGCLFIQASFTLSRTPVLSITCQSARGGEAALGSPRQGYHTHASSRLLPAPWRAGIAICGVLSLSRIADPAGFGASDGRIWGEKCNTRCSRTGVASAPWRAG